MWSLQYHTHDVLPTVGTGPALLAQVLCSRLFCYTTITCIVETVSTGRGSDLGGGSLDSIPVLSHCRSNWYTCNQEKPTLNSHIFQFLCPSEWQHESTESALDTLAGQSITFFTEEDLPRIKPIANLILGAGGQVSEFIRTTQKFERQPQNLKKRRANADINGTNQEH